MKICIIISMLLFIMTGISAQQDVFQWRGAMRDGKYPDKGLLKVWPENGPSEILKITGIGKGHSSPVICDKKIFITGLKDTMDVISAFDLRGTLLWENAYGRAWSGTYPDSRNTPAVEGDRIYISSGMGEIVCLRMADGKVIWKKNPHNEFRGIFSQWGMAESLLLTDKAVIVSVGGSDASVVALDKYNGELIWKTPPVKEDRRAYASPVMIERGGKKILLVVLFNNIYGINPENGEIYWTFNLMKDLTTESGGNRRNNANTPLYRDGEIFISSGYDSYAVMLSLSPDGRSVTLKWKNPVLDNHMGGVVEVDGYIYGSTWLSNSQGKWACVDWDTGRTLYEHEWYNKGPVIYADGHLYCLEEKSGHLALVLPDHTGFKVISSFRVREGSGPYWAHPVIWDSKLFVRHGEALMVYEIKEK